MRLIEALVLGIIQGLTEFLPVSSSGHIEIGTYLLNTDVRNNLLFSITVHGATALSTIVIFRRDIRHLLNGSFKLRKNPANKFILNILVSTIPVLFVGLFFKNQIEALFTGRILLVGFMLLITGSLLLFTYYAPRSHKSVNSTRALIIGLAQAFAILPGISRSGATIATALLMGVDREIATKFSFLMVLIPILGASVLELIQYFTEDPGVIRLSLPVIGIGFISAFISGLFACSWMIKIVKQGKLIYFSIYCYLIGLLGIISQVWV